MNKQEAHQQLKYHAFYDEDEHAGARRSGRSILGVPGVSAEISMNCRCGLSARIYSGIGRGPLIQREMERYGSTRALGWRV